MARFLFDTRPSYQRIHPWSDTLAKRPEMIECDEKGVLLKGPTLPGLTKAIALEFLGITDEVLLRAKMSMLEEGEAIDYREIDPVVTVISDADPESLPGDDSPPAESGAYVKPSKHMTLWNKSELQAHALAVYGVTLDPALTRPIMMDEVKKLEEANG